MRILNPDRRSSAIADIEKALRHRTVGQDSAVDAILNTLLMYKAGFNRPNKPIGTLLFLGPTGVGKTSTVKSAADILFGDENAVIRIDCGEFQHSHEISKLLGSPSGYLGHRETPPIFTQERINKYQTEEFKVTFLLLDEIEKASDSLWQLLLGIMDNGGVTTGDNSRADLSSCILVLTSNLGASEMASLINGGIGFKAKDIFIEEDIHSKIEKTAIEAAKRKFSPEFMNRIDKIVVFKSLTPEHMTKILELELEAIQKFIFQIEGPHFMFSCTDEVKQALLKEGTDPKYGARPLKRVIERKLIFPFSNLSSTGQINSGDSLKVSMDDKGEFIFTIEAENVFIPNLLSKHKNLTTANKIPKPSEDTPKMLHAKQKLIEAEEKLREAKRRKIAFLEE